jgi:Holliday junction resolvasome RuvABC ATP-dependent DNA helicase subunit
VQVQLDKERKRPLQQQVFHTLYYGNPGTGKTTVARLYAEFLKELGVLPGAEIEETTGAALVNGGVTELKKILSKLEKGGVLFIDEAYQLKPSLNPQGAQVSIRRRPALTTGKRQTGILYGTIYKRLWI